MEKENFKNLPYYGKPLPNTFDLENNYFLDPIDEYSYKLLKRNGIAPEWIELNKDIFSNIFHARKELKEAYIHYKNFQIKENNLEKQNYWKKLLNKIIKLFFKNLELKKQQSLLLSKKNLILKNEEKWESSLKKFKNQINSINSKIISYNLIVIIFFLLKIFFFC
jgi:hypothetical protein